MWPLSVLVLAAKSLYRRPGQLVTFAGVFLSGCPLRAPASFAARRAMTRMFRQTWLAFGLVLIGASLVQAEDAAALVTKASQQSDTAQSEADFTALLDLCQQSQQLQLVEAQEEYFTNLEAWARNKRGELYAEAALQTEDEGEIRKLEAAALNDFELAIQKNPEHWQAIHNRALSYAMLGQTERALADFDLALSLNPKFETALYNKAEMLYEAGRFAEALKGYQAVLALQPQDIGAMTGQAHCLYRLESYEQALLAYHQAVKLGPENAIAYANRADAYSDLGYWKQAIVDYQQALTLDKNLARAQQGLGWILATCPDPKLRNAELALRFAKAAVAQSEVIDFRYYDTLAAAEAATGQFDAAKQRVSQALKAAPESEKAFLQHRLALYQKRQPYREPTR